MPEINRTPIKEKTVEYKHEDNSSKFYNSIAWKRLRKFYYEHNPLCQCCLEHDKVTPAMEVHHKKPFLTGKTEEERWSLFLNQNNLMSVCNACHDKLHLKSKRYKLYIIDILTDT